MLTAVPTSNLQFNSLKAVHYIFAQLFISFALIIIAVENSGTLYIFFYLYMLYRKSKGPVQQREGMKEKGGGGVGNYMSRLLCTSKPNIANLKSKSTDL